MAKPSYRINWPDLVLIVVLVGGALYSLARGRQPDEGPPRVLVTRGGRLVATLPLDKPTEFGLDEHGEGIVIEVRGRGVRVRESNCPNQVCVRTGWISSSGQVIVCVPYQLIVEVRGGASKVDATTY